MNLSIVIPCYGSGPVLVGLVDRIERALSTLKEQGVVTLWELILVIDGSPDDAASVAEGLVLAHPEVRALELRRNYGQHNALLAGIRAARHEVIVTLDDDLQHPPEEIAALIAGLEDPRVDLVYGIPREEEHGIFRSFASKLVKRSLASAGVANARWVGAFRAFRTDLREGFAQVDDPHPNIDVLLSWSTSSVRAAPVDLQQRTVGKSGYTLGRLVVHAMNMITGYGVLPLKIATWLGFICGIFGVGLLLYTVISFATGVTTVPGFSTTIAVISLFAGAQMVTVGIIGEYLGRQHFRSMRKPTYLIGRQLEHRQDAARAPKPLSE